MQEFFPRMISYYILMGFPFWIETFEGRRKENEIVGSCWLNNVNIFNFVFIVEYVYLQGVYHLSRKNIKYIFTVFSLNSNIKDKNVDRTV